MFKIVCHHHLVPNNFITHNVNSLHQTIPLSFCPNAWHSLIQICFHRFACSGHFMLAESYCQRPYASMAGVCHLMHFKFHLCFGNPTSFLEMTRVFLYCGQITFSINQLMDTGLLLPLTIINNATTNIPIKVSGLIFSSVLAKYNQEWNCPVIWWLCSMFYGMIT